MNIGRACNQNCKQCFIDEKPTNKTNIEGEISRAERIISANKNNNFFIYPKEITTSPELVELISKIGQQYVLSNAKIIKPRFIDYLKDKGVNRIKITLFGDSEEQSFWNNNTEKEYEEIKKGIKLCAEKNITTEIFTIITPKNIEKLSKLYDLCKELKVSKINLLRVLPFGNAKNIKKELFMKEQDLEQLILVTEELKKNNGPYISFSLKFGPNFYGKSVWDCLSGKNKSRWTATETLCPAIGNRYAGVSMKTGNIYWCYYLISDPNGIIGKVSEDDRLDINSQPDFSKETLREKLRGNCSKENCEYQELCLGGCRSAAYAFAKQRGEEEPEYAGVDLCLTKTISNSVKSRLGLKQGGNENVS